MNDREPDFVNDQGVKWWLHDGVTNYAKTKKLNVMGWEVETPDGLKNFVLILNRRSICCIKHPTPHRPAGA
jgi:hypothetical protein